MKNKNETELLITAISLLKVKQTMELQVLREQFHIIYDSLKPINLLKSALTEVTNAPDAKNNIVNSIIGLTTGYLSKKLLFGGSHNPVKKIVGSLLQFGIANMVAKHADAIKASGEGLLYRVLNYRNENKEA